MLKTKTHHKKPTKATTTTKKSPHRAKKRSMSTTTTRAAATQRKTTKAHPHTRTKRNAVTLVNYQSPYDTRDVGVGLDYKLYFFNKGADTADPTTAISPWHDIPLLRGHTEKGTPIFNFVCEIPKDSTAKFEVNTKLPTNPIQQDVKNGQLRHFKYGKIPFNYGALPQTWEDPKHIDQGMKLGGDNDPVDIVELSPAPLKHGFVYPIKVIGALALIDEGEVDWKLLAINADSPLATKLDDVHHIDAFLPSVEKKLKDWFKNYKTAEGKPVNQLGHEENMLDKNMAYRVINETHQAWADLCRNGHNQLAVKPLPEGFEPLRL